MTEDNQWKIKLENDGEETEYTEDMPQTEEEYYEPPEAEVHEDSANTNEITMEMLQLQGHAKSGANWFLWIAGLSLVNSVILLSGSDWSFIVGLGATIFIDAIGLAFAEEFGNNVPLAIALVFDIIVAGVFVVIGVFAGKLHTWAFILGMILYGLDGLLFLLVGDILGLGFHIFALWCIWSGYKSHKKLVEQQKGIRYA